MGKEKLELQKKGMCKENRQISGPNSLFSLQVHLLLQLKNKS